MKMYDPAKYKSFSSLCLRRNAWIFSHFFQSLLLAITLISIVLAVKQIR